MKILHVVHGFPPAHHGGTERYVDRLVRGLDAAGHDVAVVTGSEVPSETAEIVRSNRGGVEVIEIRRSGLYLESWYRSHSPDVEALFRDVLGEEQPDLVHVHHWKRLTRTLVEVATRAGLPCVVTLHDVHSTCPKVLRFRDGSFCERPVSFASCGDCAERFFFQDDREVERLLESYRLDFAQELVAASAVIAPTQGLVHLIEEHHPAAKGRLRVLPHWRPDTQPPRRSVELASNKALHLVYWGALDPIKGPHLILEALKLVSAPQLFLVEIWGEAAAEGADYEARLQALASGLDVRFHGAFSPEDLPVALGDIAVLPSLAFETYSFTLDEAFERGLPVIVPDRGALDERAGKAGVRFEAENAADLARVFEELAGDAERLGALRAAIPLPTTEKEHLDALVGIYEEALQTEVRVDQLDARRNRSRAVNLSLQLEARDRELYALRGLADSELDRAAGLDREVALREEGIRGRDAVLESFVGNLGELSAALRVRDEDIAKLTLTIQKERDEASRRVARRDETIKQQSASLEEFALSVGQFQQLVEELRTAQRTAEERIQDLDASLHESSRAHEQAAAGLADREKRLDELQRALQASDRRADRLEQMRRNLQSEAARHESALQAALADLMNAHAVHENRVRHLFESLLPIVSEISGGPPVDVDDLIDRVRRNHARLHGLIRERDELMDHLVAGLAEQDRHEAEDAPTDARRLSARRAGLKARIGSWRRRRRKPGNPSGRLRILVVIHDFLPKHAAGTEIYAYHLCRELAQRHDLHLLFCEARHELPRYTVSKGSFDGLPYTEVVHNYKWESFEETYHDPRMEAIFEDVLDGFQPDIVHIQHLHYFSMNFIPIAKAHGLPVVYTLHEFMLLCARGGQLLREDMQICEQPKPELCADCIRHEHLAHDPTMDDTRRAKETVRGKIPAALQQAFLGYAGPSRPAMLDDQTRPVYAAAAAARLAFIAERAADVDLFISPSAFLRQKFIDSGMVREDQIIHSDNGFDLSPFQGVVRKPSDRLRFGFVGTIAEYKGVHILVEAFEGIEDDDVELQIWGDVDTFIEYKERLLPLAKNPRTQFKGRFPNGRIAEVLAGIDVLVVPSLWFENSPLTIHEAWLAGIPVLASDRGGMAELVDDGVNGLHFRLGDADDLRAKIRRLIDDRQLVRQLSNRPGVVKNIRDDAVDMEARYRRLVLGETP